MIDPGEENVPFLVLLRRSGAAAGEGLVQQFRRRNAQNVEQAPVRKRAAACTSDLIGEQAHNAFLNTVIVRLHDSRFVLISKPQQSLLLNRSKDKLMSCGIHCSRRRVPYYPE